MVASNLIIIQLNHGLNMEKKLILIVDDDEQILNMLEEGLELQNNYEIEISQNSKEFLNLVYQIKYDVLLIDHQMPLKQGSDLAIDLRRKEGPNQKAPIIFISGHLKDLKSIVKDLENIYFLQKPINLKELAKLIDQFTV